MSTNRSSFSSSVSSQHNKRRLANSSSSSSSSNVPVSSSKKLRREPETETTLNLKDALEDESNASLSSSKKCTLCASSKSLIKVEEGIHFRVNEAIDVELYLNSLLYGDDQRSVPKPILLCPRCILIVKKYIDQKSQIASLEAYKGLDDPVKLKKVKDIESMQKALKNKVSVRLKKLQDSDLLKQQPSKSLSTESENKRLSEELNKLQSELKNVSASLQDYKQRNLDLEFRCNKSNKKSAVRSNEKGAATTVARGTNTDPASSEGPDVETFQILLGERDKDMALLDRALKSTVKVKDMAISAQNLMKYKNVQLEKKIISLERAVKYSGDEKALLDSIEKITDNLDSLKSENDTITETNTKITAELSNLKEQMKALQTNYTASQDLNKKMSEEISKTNESLETKAKELDEASNKVESLTQELSSAKKEMSNIIPPEPTVSPKEVECLKEELTNKDNTIKAIKAKLSEKEVDLSLKAKRLIVLKLEKSKFEKRIQEFEKIFDGVSEGSTRKEFLIKIKNQSALICELKNELSNANKEIESKEIDNAETLCLLNSEVRELKKDLESKNEKVNSLKSALSTMKGCFDKSESEKKDLRTTLATLRSLETESRPRVGGTPMLNEVLVTTNNGNFFNLENAKEYFGAGVEKLSENHLSKCLFLVNKLMQNFHVTYGHLQGKIGADDTGLKHLYDQKFVKFSETLQLYHLGEDLIYSLYTEAFYAFFGSLPRGVFRRKLKPSDRLLKKLPNMVQAAEIVANTPILIDVLDSSSITSSATSSNTALPNPPVGRGLRVKSNLIATTANKMSTTNTITQSSYNSPLARNTIANEVPRVNVQQMPMMPPQPVARPDGQICYTTTVNGHGAPLQPLDNLSQILSMPPNVNITQ